MKDASFEERCLAFSANILKLASSDVLPKTSSVRTIADQLFRSGTSVGANVHEARAAESRADFIHKMQIALKESREVNYWLALIQKAGVVETDPFLLRLSQESSEISAILAKSVITAKKNGDTRSR